MMTSTLDVQPVVLSVNSGILLILTSKGQSDLPVLKIPLRNQLTRCFWPSKTNIRSPTLAPGDKLYVCTYACMYAYMYTREHNPVQCEVHSIHSPGLGRSQVHVLYTPPPHLWSSEGHSLVGHPGHLPHQTLWTTLDFDPYIEDCFGSCQIPDHFINHIPHTNEQHCNGIEITHCQYNCYSSLAGQTFTPLRMAWKTSFVK